MAESVDALVSNTSGAIHPGSIPGLGTTEKVEKLSPFSFSLSRARIILGIASRPLKGENSKLGYKRTKCS